MSDLIRRAEAKEALRERLKRIPTYAIWAMHIIDELPSVQPTQLTDEDKETIRIHLNAFKESLCNQGRWYEATEYEELIHRLLSIQPRKGKWIIDKDKFGYYVSECSNCHWLGHGHKALMYNPNFCPNCGCRMEEGDSDD